MPSGIGDINPTLKYAIKALKHHSAQAKLSPREHRAAAARDVDARHFISSLVMDRLVSMGASRVTDAIVRSQLAHSLSGNSVQGLLRQMYDTPFGRSLIHHIAGDGTAHASDGSVAAIAAAYEKIGTNAVASVVTMLLRCGWDLMEVLMGKKQWRDFWRSFVIAVGGTMGGIVGWAAGAGVSGTVVTALPILAPVAHNVGSVCAFLGTMLGDYVAGAATARFVEWFMGDDLKKKKKQKSGGDRGREKNARGADGRRRERSGEGRSSREDGPRRPLPRRVPRVKEAPAVARDAQWVVERPRVSDASRVRDAPWARDSNRPRSRDGPYTRYNAPDDRRREPLRLKDRKSARRRADSSDSDTDSDSDGEIGSDSAYNSAPPRFRVQAVATAATTMTTAPASSGTTAPNTSTKLVRPRLQRPDSYIRRRCDSYMQDHNHEREEGVVDDAATCRPEPLLLKEHDSPLQGGLDIRRGGGERRRSGQWGGEVVLR
jgi:hypothetical protein